MGNSSSRKLYSQQTIFQGWQAYEIGNELIRLIAVPDIGGRIMAYDLGPYPYLYVDCDLAGKLFSAEENQGDGSLAAWKNYGGDKTWPSPQGWSSAEEWAGPPDCILDTGRYQLDACTAGAALASIKMTSPTGSPTGVQITRQASIHPGSSRVTLDLSFCNISERKVRWSIWDVVQLRAERVTAAGQLAPEPECVVSAPLNPKSKFDPGYYVMFGEPENPQWKSDKGSGLFLGNYKWEIGKVGLDSRGGWAAFANNADGQAFAARYISQPGQEYPDDGADVEFWTVGRGKVANLDYEQSRIYLMELEILSPFYEIEPGQTASFRIEWGACRCLGPILDVTEGGCTGRRLLAQRDDGHVRVQGGFGVFDRGRLRLEWTGRDGQMFGAIDLGAVSPLTEVVVDERVPVAKEATQARLVVVVNEVQHLLAQVEIT
jgi:hypothetical protein